MTQELNVCEEVQQNENIYQEKVRVEELCPHICNSIEELLLMSVNWVDSLNLWNQGP